MSREEYLAKLIQIVSNFRQEYEKLEAESGEYTGLDQIMHIGITELAKKVIEPLFPGATITLKKRS